MLSLRPSASKKRVGHALSVDSPMLVIPPTPQTDAFPSSIPTTDTPSQPRIQPHSQRIHPNPHSLLASSSSDTSSTRSRSPTRRRRFRSNSADQLSQPRRKLERTPSPSPLEAEWQAEIERRFIETGLKTATSPSNALPITPSTSPLRTRDSGSPDAGRLSPFRPRQSSIPQSSTPSSRERSPFLGAAAFHPEPPRADDVDQCLVTPLSPAPRPGMRSRAGSSAELDTSPTTRRRTPSPQGFAHGSAKPQRTRVGPPSSFGTRSALPSQSHGITPDTSFEASSSGVSPTRPRQTSAPAKTSLATPISTLKSTLPSSAPSKIVTSDKHSSAPPIESHEQTPLPRPHTSSLPTASPSLAKSNLSPTPKPAASSQSPFSRLTALITSSPSRSSNSPGNANDSRSLLTGSPTSIATTTFGAARQHKGVFSFHMPPRQRPLSSTTATTTGTTTTATGTGESGTGGSGIAPSRTRSISGTSHASQNSRGTGAGVGSALGHGQGATSSSKANSPPRRSSADWSSTQVTKKGSWEHGVTEEMISLSLSFASPKRGKNGSSSTISADGAIPTTQGSSHSKARRKESITTPSASASTSVPPLPSLALPKSSESPWKLDLAIPTPHLDVFADSDSFSGIRSSRSKSKPRTTSRPGSRRQRRTSNASTTTASSRPKSMNGLPEWSKKIGTGSGVWNGNEGANGSNTNGSTMAVPFPVVLGSQNPSLNPPAAVAPTGNSLSSSASRTRSLPLFPSSGVSSFATPTPAIVAPSTKPIPSPPATQTSGPALVSNNASPSNPSGALPPPSSVPSATQMPTTIIKGRGKRMNSEGDQLRPVGRTISSEVPMTVRLVPAVPKGILKREGSGTDDALGDGLTSPLKRLRLSYSTPPDLVHRASSSLRPSPHDLYPSDDPQNLFLGRAGSQRSASLPAPPEGDEGDDELPHNERETSRMWRSSTPRNGRRSVSPSLFSGRAKSPSLRLSLLLNANPEASTSPSPQSSIPFRALITPRPPSVSLSHRGSAYHMNDPNTTRRPGSRATSFKGSSLHSKEGTAMDDEDRWMDRIREFPVETWCFIFGFLIPVFWWIGSFSQTRLGQKLLPVSRGDGSWPPDRGYEHYQWRRWCRVMTAFSIVVYIPIIVLAIVFTR